jgi:hypothetical protein
MQAGVDEKGSALDIVGDGSLDPFGDTSAVEVFPQTSRLDGRHADPPSQHSISC